MRKAESAELPLPALVGRMRKVADCSRVGRMRNPLGSARVGRIRKPLWPALFWGGRGKKGEFCGQPKIPLDTGFFDTKKLGYLSSRNRLQSWVNFRKKVISFYLSNVTPQRPAPPQR